MVFTCCVMAVPVVVRCGGVSTFLVRASPNEALPNDALPNKEAFWSMLRIGGGFTVGFLELFEPQRWRRLRRPSAMWGEKLRNSTRSGGLGGEKVLLALFTLPPVEEAVLIE